MNKVDLVNAVAGTKGIELSKKDVAVVLDATFTALATGLKKEGKAAIPGFGTFKVRDRKAREGINPITKAPLKIAASKAVTFKAAPDLKKTVGGKDGAKAAPKASAVPTKPAAAKSTPTKPAAKEESKATG